MHNLAVILRNQGKFEEAAARQQEVVERSQNKLGPDHANTLPAMSNLAAILRDQGKATQAADLQRGVVKAISEAPDSDSRDIFPNS
jgi:hypothetical protein